MHWLEVQAKSLLIEVLCEFVAVIDEEGASQEGDGLANC